MSGYPTNMTVQVTRPGGSSSVPGHPWQTEIAQGPPPVGRHLCLAVPVPARQEQEPHLWLPDQLEAGQFYSVGQSGSGGKENTSFDFSRNFSPPRQPPPASCRDGPVQPHLLQLEMEGSRWPCLAQIPARLPGRCGQSDRVGVRSREYTGGREPPLCCYCGVLPVWGGGDTDGGLIMVLETADAQSPLERDSLCLLRPG